MTDAKPRREKGTGDSNNTDKGNTVAAQIYVVRIFPMSGTPYCGGCKYDEHFCLRCARSIVAHGEEVCVMCRNALPEDDE